MTESAQCFLTGRAVAFQISLVTFTVGIPAVLFGWGLVSQKLNWVVRSLLTVNALMAVPFLLFFADDRVVRGLFVINNVWRSASLWR
jgi:hypothetical protein